MLYSFVGSNIEKSRIRARATYTSLLKKRPDALFVRLTSENFSKDVLLEHTESLGLFTERFIVFLDLVSEEKENKNILLDSLEDISASQNVFVVLEGELDKAFKNKLEKYSEKIEEHTSSRKDTKQSLNIFSLNDPLIARDSKRLWKMYQEALRQGVSSEDIYNVLLWQIKTANIVLQTKSAKEAGIKPFVFNKAKGFLKKYSVEEIKKLHKEMIELLQDSRQKNQNLEFGLEKMILSL